MRWLNYQYKHMLKKSVKPLLTTLREREQRESEHDRWRLKQVRILRARGITNEKEIENRLAMEEYEMQKAEEKKKRARYQLADPTKMSCNTSKLKLDESEPEDIGDLHKLKQDLYGVETDFKYDFRFDKPIEPLKIEERNMRVAKARLRLRQRKAFAED